MQKTFLIIKREYLTRIKKKAFIIMTILGPLLFGLMMVVPMWLMTRDLDEKTIKVLDESGFFANKFENSSEIRFEYITDDLEKAKDYVGGDVYGVLHIPSISIDDPSGITLFTEGSTGFEVQNKIRNTLSREIEDMRLKESGIDPQLLKELQKNVKLNTINMAGGEEKEGNSAISSVVGYVSSLLIYFFIFYYGIQIMRGVIEEKSSKIIEVIISSVRPFQLMMGKIIGVGAVGLTQFVIWSVLSTLIYSVVLSVYGPGGMTSNPDVAQAAAEVGKSGEGMELLEIMGNIDFTTILISFVFYFLASYLLYGSLFAAIGSAVDNDSDAQQFQLPVTMPLIFSIVVLGAVLKDPDGSLAFWMSMVPLTSPIVMMMRIPFGVPVWQLIMSMSLLVLAFLFTTWVASRIYRVGVVMHGAKPKWGTLVKWFLMKY